MPSVTTNGGIPPMTVKISAAEAAKLKVITSKLKRSMKHGKKAHTVNELAAIKHLSEGFQIFGYDKGDRVRLRDRVDIYKDNIIIARVKDNYLYAINDKNQLTRVTHAHKKLCKKATDKILFAYNSNRKIRQM